MQEAFFDKKFIDELQKFHKLASTKTYASKDANVKSQRKGFNELEYKNRKFYYRDSYVGFYRSFGQEVIYYDDKPVWTCIYGQGMKSNYHQFEFAINTFNFLKTCLAKDEQITDFVPRGPRYNENDEFQYKSDWIGDIRNFEGKEEILKKANQQIVFTHIFFGGLIIE